MDVIERVIAKWRRDGLDVNAGASGAQLRLLEDRLGCQLPADVRFYFSAANGSGDSPWDEHQVVFWSIDRILAEADERIAAMPEMQARDLPIADVLINSWFIALRPLATGGVSIVVPGAFLELSSLTEFFAAYEADPRSLCL